MTTRDPDTDVELGEPVPLEPHRRPPAIVLSVRVSGEMLASLELAAKREHTTLSGIARMAIEAFVRGVRPQVRYAFVGSSSGTVIISGPTTALGDQTQNVGGGLEAAFEHIAA